MYLKVNYKQSLTGFNSEFYFSYTCCLTNARRSSLSYLVTHTWRENNQIYSFSKDISAI